MWLRTVDQIQIIRDTTGCYSSEISDNQLLEWINIEYPKILNRVYFRDKNYGYDEWTTTLVAGQNKYSLLDPVEVSLTAPITPGIFWQSDISKILTKYDTTQQYYWEVTMVGDNNLYNDKEYVAATQPKDRPLYILYIDYFYLMPTPLVTVANGLKMTGTKAPYKLTLDTTYWVGYGGTADDCLLPDQYQDILAWAVRPYIYRYRKNWNDMQIAIRDFQDKELDMTYNIAYTNTEPVEWLQTDYTSLC